MRVAPRSRIEHIGQLDPGVAGSAAPGSAVVPRRVGAHRSVAVCVLLVDASHEMLTSAASRRVAMDRRPLPGGATHEPDAGVGFRLAPMQNAASRSRRCHLARCQIAIRRRQLTFASLR
jgi:hypothetical protein